MSPTPIAETRVGSLISMRDIQLPNLSLPSIAVLRRPTPLPRRSPTRRPISSGRAGQIRDYGSTRIILRGISLSRPSSAAAAKSTADLQMVEARHDTKPDRDQASQNKTSENPTRVVPEQVINLTAAEVYCDYTIANHHENDGRGEPRKSSLPPANEMHFHPAYH